MLQTWKSQFLIFYEKHKTRIEVIFFVGGFVFDALLVSEPDEVFAIVQQIIYLIIIGALLHYELLFRVQKWRPEGRWLQAWNYRDLLLHFLLGTLLNIYSLFYIKSASLVSSLVFLIFMIGFIIANELPIIKKSKVSFKVGLYSICLFSFLSILYPILLGHVGWLPLSLSVVSSLALFYLQFYFLQKRLQDLKTVFRAVLFPGISVLLVFLGFTVMGWIPPVPLSAEMQGIYHMVEKKDGEFLLSTERKWWKFWQSGDQEFLAQPGDKIYFYIQIYSPARFSDQVWIHWLWKDPKRGWQSADRIPLKILGGRKEGFRGFASKTNYQEGEWRVQVETSNQQEISRLYFEVHLSDKVEPREFTILRK